MLNSAPTKSPFFGPDYTSRYPFVACQRCVNLYPEIVETKTGRDVGALYNSPGLDRFGSFGTGPIRAMATMQGVMYVISGNSLYSVTAGGFGTLLGTIGGPGAYLYSIGHIAPGFTNINLPFDPNEPGIVPQISSQVFMTNTNTDLLITVGFNCTQQDGFGIIYQPGSYNWFQSNLLDLSTWPATQFASASADSTNIKAIVSNKREVFIIKTRVTEVWQNAGLPNFVFQREQGPYANMGTLSPASVAVLGENIFWLGTNKDSESPVAVMLQNYQIVKISTFGLDDRFRRYGTWTDAIGYGYQQDGHQFYVLTFPTADETWVYDKTTSTLMGAPMWHQRASFSTTQVLNPTSNDNWHRHWGNCATVFNGSVMVGDYSSNNIYVLDLDTPTDNGTQRKWLRSWRGLPQSQGRLGRFNSLRIDMQQANVPVGSNPQVILRWSDDGGFRWANPMVQSVTPITGNPAIGSRVKFNRLGALRMANGYDRMFELSSSDVFPVAMVDAFVE